MANQRPIRRGKFPVFRKKRPVRWMASTPDLSGNQTLGLIIQEGAGSVRLPLVELVSGQADVEPWSDDQEVTIDRIVGGIRIDVTQDYTGVSPATALALAPPTVRLGLVVAEDAAATGTLDLFDDATLQQTEWMWLWQGSPTLGVVGGTNGELIEQWMDVQVDLRNRRKLGFADHLLLYGNYAYNGGANATLRSQTFVFAVQSLRAILMGR